MARNARSENSWERQPGESAKAFEAFDLYCKMGSERSLGKVGQKLGKSATLIERWSSRWNWVKRSRDYDNEIKRQELQAEKKAYQTMRKRQIGMAIQFQKKAFDALQKLPIEAMTPKDIKEFMKLGAELERLNRTFDIDKQEEAEESKEFSLADAIISSYQNRKENENDD